MTCRRKRPDTGVTCQHIRDRVTSLQRNSDLGFLNSRIRRVKWIPPGSWTCLIVVPHCVTWNLQWRHLSHTTVRNPFSPRLLLQRRIAQASAERSNHDSTGRSSSRGFTGAKIVAQLNISVSDFDLVVCGSGMSFRPPHPALHVLSWQAQRLPW